MTALTLAILANLILSISSYLLCPRAASPTYFRYPEDLDCNSTDTYKHGYLNLYVPNVEVRDIKASMLWEEEITCTTKYFFFGSYTETITTKIVPIRLSKAMDYLQDGICRMGALTKEDIVCEYKWPQTASVTKTFCLKIKGELLVSKGEVLSSTLGDTSHCSLNAKHCLLSNDKHLFWEVTGEEAMKYKMPMNYSYVTVGERYLLNQLSVSLRLGKKIQYNGRSVYSSKEGFLVDIITQITVKSDNWDRFNYEADDRIKRSISDMRGELEGKIQYVFDYVYSFLGKTPMICIMVNLHSRIIQQQAQLQPTLYARAALRNPKVIAHATQNFLIVSPCILVKSTNLPVYNDNTSSILVNVTIKGKTFLYHLDPSTNEITLHRKRIIEKWELPLILEVNGTTIKVFQDRSTVVTFNQEVHNIPIFKKDNILLPHLDLDDAWVYTDNELSNKAYWNFINSYQNTHETLHQYDSLSHTENFEDASKYDLRLPFISNLTYLASIIEMLRLFATVGGMWYLLNRLLNMRGIHILTTLIKTKREGKRRTAKFAPIEMSGPITNDWSESDAECQRP